MSSQSITFTNVPFSNSYFYPNNDQKLKDFQYNAMKQTFENVILAHLELTPYSHKKIHIQVTFEFNSYINHEKRRKYTFLQQGVYANMSKG